MIEVDITDEMLSRAISRTEASLYIFKDSLRLYTKTLHGNLGEEVVSEVINEKVLRGHQKGRDFYKDGKYYEVKTRSITQVPIYHHYSVSVYKKSTNADNYIFVFIQKNLKKGVIVGSMSVKDFNKKAVWAPRGKYGWEVHVSEVEEWYNE